jgi:hypothetical protein
MTAQIGKIPTRWSRGSAPALPPDLPPVASLAGFLLNPRTKWLREGKFIVLPRRLLGFPAADLQNWLTKGN